MMPGYRSMDSYPYQRNQTPFPHSYYPSTDPSKPPFSCEQFCPYPYNYGHPIPPYFCCGHSNFPGYYSHRPSYPHAPSPSPLYYHGGYPSYGEPSFVRYPPQPHYTMELPRYEYDKLRCEPPEHHCCGCPNHPCTQKEAKSVKIEEEHEPGAGKKVSNDALVPIQFKNYPYPYVWIPPENTSNKQTKNPVVSEVVDQGGMASHDNKHSGLVDFNGDAHPAQEPRVCNGWLPFDLKGVPNMVQDGDGMRSRISESDNNRRESEDGRMNQKQQNEHKRNGFPFPVIWFPYYNKQEEDGKNNNQGRPNHFEDMPHTFKVVPVNSYADRGVTNGTRSNQDASTITSGSSNQDASTTASGSDVVEKKKVTNERTIPVKQIELHQGGNGSKGSDEKEKMEENVTKESSSTNGKRQSTSPPKASKLPPVCLRVDPLPKKKNGSRSSRSPSPPSSKDHSQAAAGDSAKTASGEKNDKAQPNSNIQDVPNTRENVKPKEWFVQVSENKASETKDSENKAECKSQMDVNVPSGDSMESYTAGDKDNTEDKKAEKGAENMTEEVRDSSTPADEARKVRGVLSDVDAAVLIQAAYRGYLVRKWEPLKKLKQIAEVCKGLEDVRSRIQAFEGSADLQNDEKQKIAIGETIMSLLLKLDTIQGLHPSFREIRKSLARELVTLQERLDSIGIKKPEPQMQEAVIQQSIEVPPLNTQSGDHVQEQQEEQAALPEDSSGSINGGSHDKLEKCEDRNASAIDVASESHSSVDLASNEEREPTIPSNSLASEDTCQEVDVVDELNSTSDHVETDKVVMEREAEPAVNNIRVEDDKPDVIALKELPVDAIDEDINDTSHEKDEENDTERQEDDSPNDGALMKELPVGVLDEEDDTTNSEFEKQEMKELPLGLLDEEDTATPELEKVDEMSVAKEEPQAEKGEYLEGLPVGVLDEDTTKSEHEKKHGETRTYREVLLAQEANEKTDDSVKETQQEEQLLEEKEEVQSSGDSDGWVKVESQKEDEQLKGDAALDIESKSQSGVETGTDTMLPFLTTQENDASNTLLEPIEVVQSSESHKNAKIAQVDDKDTNTLAMERSEELQLPVAEHDGGSNSDTKLLEENENLRKMMMKLLEAGNDQLTVISNLTERVKDLEKKLAKTKSKRVKTKRRRPTTSKASNMKGLDNPLQGRRTGVAL